MKRLYKGGHTRQRRREVGKDKGKNRKGRREWERRWREVGDIMNEEDVMETSIMHLCIPDSTRQPSVHPSDCSGVALSLSISLSIYLSIFVLECIVAVKG